MNNNRTILFDWNGTLLDDADLAVSVMNELLHTKKMKEVSIEFYRDFFDFPVIKYYRLLGFDTEERWQTASKRFVQGYVDRMFTPQLFGGVKEGLTQLKNAGFRLGIVSAMEHSMLLKQTEFYGLHNFIPLIQGIEDTNGHGKLHLAEKVRQKWDINPQKTCYVGDTTHDRDFSDALGSRIILKSGGHNSFERLQQSGEEVVKSFSELIKKL
ncbi:HAD family hydrolase [bacterium]|nr:HAD family hydrolase [bacterium]